METTSVTYPIVTAITENGIEIYMRDVAEYNANSAGFFNSVAKFANNVIDMVKSCFGYLEYVAGVANELVTVETLPACIGIEMAIMVFGLWFWFVRNGK